MEWINDLLFGSSIAHSIFILALTIALGVLLAKIKIGGVSLGMTWILFVGIAASHFGMGIGGETLEFVKEFGLILFVFSIGLQVGPGFFSSFKKGGLKLNGLAVLVVLLGTLVTYLISVISGTNLSTMTGVLAGAVTNTPSLGAAQQVYSDTMGSADATIAMGYAVAYPLGVVGVICSILLLKRIFKVNTEKENEAIEAERVSDPMLTKSASIKVLNSAVFGQKVVDIRSLVDKKFVISRIMHADGTVTSADGESVVGEGDTIYVVAQAAVLRSFVPFVGEEVDMPLEEWEKHSGGELVSRRIVLTKSQYNGRRLGDIKLRSIFGVNVTRVNRSGIDLVATPDLELQLGDRLTIVGEEERLEDVSKLLGNQLKRLREPNLLPIFIGIVLGVIVGIIPIYFGSMPQPVKLGLAGGPLLVAILIGRFGPHYRMVTYTTMSANLMLREIGISLFLAAVGLGAGETFVDTIVSGGWQWIGYGALITIVPFLIVGFIARRWAKLNYFSMMGMLVGSTTNPVALAYLSSNSPNDIQAVSYSTVYPLTMFLRVLAAQVLILMAI